MSLSRGVNDLLALEARYYAVFNRTSPRWGLGGDHHDGQVAGGLQLVAGNQRSRRKEKGARESSS
ncbi:hypothetical protein PC128_g20135 [Phytophthora cactorum]|nr:hypothetical protein PC128_g20135 [Phytophthora cactorum]